ncbi:CPCC family cysteine-rich protein [Alkalihalobacillus pseudalcaliphilus]|uniref:CPCC family cysteine-rich protein n=1 Tax=Alkalihalobacillus pseudalcaliphilus TaxID=79884 RepID=UPI00064DC945|nr:CPCC family cysteine-rich protein [Alkalihalobacillus pseudalcaliphilus]KMK76250.1 hydrolase [Alkalihalobacillus pseudalcaliphilus]
MRKYTCPCCGYKTLAEAVRDSYDICEVCYWEDDFVQNEDPDYGGGANQVSLRQAQRNFLTFGASELTYKELVVEPGSKGYEKDRDFKVFS